MHTSSFSLDNGYVSPLEMHLNISFYIITETLHRDSIKKTCGFFSHDIRRFGCNTNKCVILKSEKITFLGG